MNNVFDWLKQINYQKSPVESFTDKDWEVFNSYMIHRFMSMNQDFIEVVNYVQELPPQEKRMIYNVYKEFIPKNNKWKDDNSASLNPKNYAGFFHTNYSGISSKKRNVMGMVGYGGQSIIIDFDKGRINVINSIHIDYNWKKLVHSVIKKGK